MTFFSRFVQGCTKLIRRVYLINQIFSSFRRHFQVVFFNEVFNRLQVETVIGWGWRWSFSFCVQPTVNNWLINSSSPGLTITKRLWRTSSRLDFRRLPGPVFDPPRRETAGRVTRWPCLWRTNKSNRTRVTAPSGGGGAGEGLRAGSFSRTAAGHRG